MDMSKIFKRQYYSGIVLYCNGYVNVPESTLDRHVLLTKEYGDYSVVTYEHHGCMCRFWNG